VHTHRERFSSFSLYETEPVDYLDQAWFLNMAIEAETELGALETVTRPAPKSKRKWAARN